VNQVVLLPTPIDADGPDVMGWEDTNTYKFTIQSAYRLQHGDIHALEGDWNSLWDWKGPHRIKTFIWLAAQERILTNFRRSKWGVAYLQFVLDVGEKMKLPFMCSEIVSMQFRYGSA
jgi:hypothetical protein